MRLLHLTDTHFGVDRWFRGAPRGWRRADDHLAIARVALAPALAGEVDAVVHTGDLFDRSRPTDRAVAAAAELLEEVARAVPLLVMPGNHDRRGLGGHFPRAAWVIDRPTVVDLAGVRVAAVPFLRDAGTWAAAAREVCAGGVDLLLAHQAFEGARVPGHTFRSEPDTIRECHLPTGVTTILCGHIHPRQVTRVGGAVVVQPGSTERTAFSERFDTKGALRWEDGAWRFVDLPARPMALVRGPDELAAVGPGTLVRLEPGDEDLEAAVLARGGWVAPWARPSAQVPLFG
ncbi:MAG: metallophosphoesterase family protein [Myxococcota bacterium]